MVRRRGIRAQQGGLFGVRHGGFVGDEPARANCRRAVEAIGAGNLVAHAVLFREGALLLEVGRLAAPLLPHGVATQFERGL